MKNAALLFLLLILSGCSAPPPSGPSVELQFLEDGAPMTNRFSLVAQREVIRSHLVLSKTVNALNLADAWEVDRDMAVARLRDSLHTAEDTSHGTLTVRLRGLLDEDRAEILNTLCEQIPKESESVYDPTPVMDPREYDPKKHPDGFPQSANARTVQIQTEIVRRAE